MESIDWRVWDGVKRLKSRWLLLFPPPLQKSVVSVVWGSCLSRVTQPVCPFHPHWRWWRWCQKHEEEKRVSFTLETKKRERENGMWCLVEVVSVCVEGKVSAWEWSISFNGKYAIRKRVERNVTQSLSFPRSRLAETHIGLKPPTSSWGNHFLFSLTVIFSFFFIVINLTFFDSFS